MRISRPFPLARRALRALLPLAIAAAAGACGTAAAREAQPDPATVVRTLYTRHFGAQQNWEETYRAERALFAPELAQMLDADDAASAANQDEVVGLDFDPLTWSQDTMTGFDVLAATRDGGDMVVPVVIRQDTAKQTLRVRLGASANVWRIKNIHYPEGDLVSILHQLAADRRKTP
jgi:hypothetical protein